MIPTRRLASVLPILFTASAIHAQSLVINHDFETLTSTLPGWCPSFGSQIYLAAGWQTPAIAITPDYFHACGLPHLSVPSNGFGFEPDKLGGQGYAAIMAFNTSFPAREYVQAPLKAALVKGVTYNVSFDVSLAERSEFAIDRLGAYLGEEITTATHILNDVPQIGSSGMLANANGWTTISGQYVASGGEEWITIGNFGDAALTNLQVRTGFVFPFTSFYYIDNVVVAPATSDARAYITTFDEELLAVDLDAGAICSVTAIGTTQDVNNGPIREIRGLSYDGRVLWGMTHQGDLVTVNPSSAETTHVYTLTAGNQADEYWNSLALLGTSSLITVNRSWGPPGGHELVGLDIGPNPPVEATIGSTNYLGSGSPVGALALYPQSAPVPPPTFDGSHPATSTIYGQDDVFLGANPFRVMPGSGEITTLYPYASPAFLNRGFQFDPVSGVLKVLHDLPSLPGSTAFSSFAFDTQAFTTICDMPQDLGTPDFPDTAATGLALIPSTLSVEREALKVCVTGVSTGVGWSWSVNGRTGDVPPVLPVGAPESAIAAAFVQSLIDHGIRAYVDKTVPDCLNLVIEPLPAAPLLVGPLGSPNCLVLNNPNGCTVNPTLLQAGYQLPFPIVGTDSPAGFLLTKLEAHPNPFNPSTSIQFVLTRDAHTLVEIYDLRGQRVRVLVNQVLPAGAQKLTWNGRDDGGSTVSSGVYLVRVQSENQQRSLKISLIK